MKYSLYLFITILIIMSSCSVECEKTLKGTIVDAITGEALTNVNISVEARNNSKSGFGGSYQYYEDISDNNGSFEVQTNWDLDKWTSFELALENYRQVGSQFANDQTEVCGENHVEISMHRLSTLELQIVDDPNLDSYSVSIWTKFSTFSSGGQVPPGETYQIPVLEEVPNMIFINHFNEVEGFTHRDTIIVEIPRGETQFLQLAI